LEPRGLKRRGGGIVAERKIKRGHPEIVEHRFVAAGDRRPHALSFSRTIPIRSRGDRAGESRETDEPRIVAVSLADELADIELTLLSHLRRARVAEVRVVFPDDDFRSEAATTQMFGERVDGLSHVLIAQVPRRHASG